MVESVDTIAAIATAPGKGGIGIVRLSGPEALSIASSVTGKNLRSRQATYSSFKSTNGLVIDHGIVIYFPSPASYTGEDVIELQGHGGQAVLGSLLRELINQGARLALPGEFTERAFHNDKMDLLQAEAIADLIDSASEEAACSALRSLTGEFSRKIDDLLKDLIAIRVSVEGALDFSEEEIDFLNNSEVSELISETLKRLEQTLQEARHGQTLKDGISIAIIGPPNVGKSSLLNRLSKFEKAIVSPTPGTTRDKVEELILIDGVPVNVVDTAGIRATTDSVEQEGISRTWAAMENADQVILMYEAKKGAQEQQGIINERLPVKKKVIVLYNKIDLLGMQAQSKNESGQKPEVFISIKTGEGMGLLEDLIKKQMGLTGRAEAALSARTRHIEALEKAVNLLVAGLNKLKSRAPAAELLAEDLQQAQWWLETITGKSTPDDLLGEIFSKFCIGK